MTRRSQNRDGLNIETFARELASIKDVTMRGHRICERLKGMEPEDASLLLEDLIKGARLGKTRHRSVYLALIKHRDLTDSVGYEKVTQIYTFSKKEGYSNVLEFLRSAGKTTAAPKEVIPSKLANKLKHLTLGEKKAFARRHDYKNLEFLLHDTDPRVIENLLKNPKLTENDVVKIASNKQTTAEVLVEVFKNERWSSRYRIRKSLIFNELTPLDIALNLCMSMLKQDLRMISGDANLNGELVKRAKWLLKAKGKE